jgi:hypothetical protein
MNDERLHRVPRRRNRLENRTLTYRTAYEGKRGLCTSIEDHELLLTMAELVTNLVRVPLVLGVYIKLLYDVIDISIPALELARDCGGYTLRIEPTIARYFQFWTSINETSKPVLA